MFRCVGKEEKCFDSDKALGFIVVTKDMVCGPCLWELINIFKVFFFKQLLFSLKEK